HYCGPLCRRPLKRRNPCVVKYATAATPPHGLKGLLSKHYHSNARYEVRPRKDKRGVDLISDALPFGRLWYDGPNAVVNAIGYAMHVSRSHAAVIRVYDAAGDVIETLEYKGDFREP